VRCMTPVRDTCGFFIYKRTDLWWGSTTGAEMPSTKLNMQW
jgi:hypothetical protein